MKCPECGAEVGAGEKFCGNCGAPFEATESSSPAEEPAIPSGDETIMSELPPLPPVEPSGPPPPPPPPPPAAEGQDKKKMWIIVAIVVVVLLLCCCCVAGVGLFLNSGAGQDVLRELGMVLPTLSALV